MKSTRNYYNYQSTKHKERPTAGSLTKLVCRSTEDLENDRALAQTPPPNQEAILLRTAQAERVLHLQTKSQPVISASAVSANNVGIKCWHYDLPRSFRNFMDAAELDPRFAAAHNNLGVAYIAIGDLEQAIRAIGKAIGIDESKDVAHANLGLAYLEKGDYHAAYQSLRNAMLIAPYHPAHYSNMGVLWLDAGKPEAAKDCFQYAIGIDATNAATWRNLGYAHREAQEHDLAADCFSKAEELEHPQCPASH